MQPEINELARCSDSKHKIYLSTELQEREIILTIFCIE